MVHLEEKLETVEYYILKQWKEHIYDGVVRGILQHKMCLFSNYIVRTKEI
jgi:hypothetical protein